MSETRTLRIDIWSDVMCPWCLVGWGSLQKDAQLEGEIEADIRWHAFELNPDMAPEGEGRTAHIARKYGTTTEQSKAVQGRMREAAENAGVSLDYEAATPNPGHDVEHFRGAQAADLGGRGHGPQRQTALKLAVPRALQPPPRAGR